LPSTRALKPESATRLRQNPESLSLKKEGLNGGIKALAAAPDSRDFPSTDPDPDLSYADDPTSWSVPVEK